MKWRWMAGMRATNGARVINVCDDGYVEGFLGAQMVEVDEECEPDWDDPATIGCLLAQVRDLYPNAWARRMGDGWCVFTSAQDVWTTVAIGKTEAEALLAALEVRE